MEWLLPDDKVSEIRLAPWQGVDALFAPYRAEWEEDTPPWWWGGVVAGTVPFEGRHTNYLGNESYETLSCAGVEIVSLDRGGRRWPAAEVRRLRAAVEAALQAAAP